MTNKKWTTFEKKTYIQIQKRITFEKYSSENVI